MTQLIALTGLIGSGKSTVAKHLVAQHGFVLVKFAGGLKAMLHALLDYSLIQASTIDAMIEGDLKETPASILSHHTPRHAMQTLGTEWGRNLIGQDFWVQIAASRIQQIRSFNSPVVVDDCRYPNEATLIRQLGGTIWKLSRPGAAVDSHSSESDQKLVVADRMLLNNVGIGDLLVQVDKAVKA